MGLVQRKWRNSFQKVYQRPKSKISSVQPIITGQGASMAPYLAIRVYAASPPFRCSRLASAETKNAPAESPPRKRYMMMRNPHSICFTVSSSQQVIDLRPGSGFRLFGPIAALLQNRSHFAFRIVDVAEDADL